MWTLLRNACRAWQFSWFCFCLFGTSTDRSVMISSWISGKLAIQTTSVFIPRSIQEWLIDYPSAMHCVSICAEFVVKRQLRNRALMRNKLSTCLRSYRIEILCACANAELRSSVALCLCLCKIDSNVNYFFGCLFRFQLNWQSFQNNFFTIYGSGNGQTSEVSNSLRVNL